MEKSRKELEALVISQKEQLSRYETRLKDVVIAYKGLLKEKEALEASFTALSSGKDRTQKDVEPDEGSASSLDTESSTNLQLQIATLMNSLATLSAEKSRMEASFQGDKKQLRNDIAIKDKTINDLQEKIKEANKQSAVDIENSKSKIIIERHEREKESNNHMVMIRELQKLYADERHLKENLEMQLNDLKTQFSIENSGNKIKDLMAELQEAKEKLKHYENRKEHFSQENSSILLELQNEMQTLKQQHAIAIKTEQKRAYVAEERNKKLAVLHEDRVANLEARLAELSHTVGSYDRLRQQDQENIQKLKEKISQLANSEVTGTELKDKESKDVSSIMDEIMQLKKLLIIENARSPNPVDINKIFNTRADHTQCLEDVDKIHAELDLAKTENLDLKQAIAIQKSHIKTLQEKVKVLNRNIDEQEMELKIQADKLNQAVKMERSKWKDIVNTLDNEYRCKLSDLEQQLQKQRVRSLQLLDEKENEIKALQTSFEIFTPQNISKRMGDENRGKKDKDTGAGSLCTNSSIVPSVNENCHMLHYASELARRDVEISSLRKSKHSAETALRQALQDKVTAQEELNDKIIRLEEQVDRLERCKTREGANLEYLKNVVFSFLSTSDADGKRHMVNAIGAVLQFTPGEMRAINNLFHKK